MDFANRLYFSATRARRIAVRRGVRKLAAQAAAARRQVVAGEGGDRDPAAMPRALRYAWVGGQVALARAGGVERIAEGRDAGLGTTCPAITDVDFDLFSTPAAPPVPTRTTSVSRRKAGPLSTGRDDAAIADLDNARARCGRAA